MALILGKPLAETTLIAIKERVVAFVARHKAPPTLALIRVGEDAASAVYLKNKVCCAEKVGIRTQLLSYPTTALPEEVARQIAVLNADSTVHGIIVQLPLPHHFAAEALIEQIAPEKDVDGLTTTTQGHLFRGAPCLAPCTAQGILQLLRTVHRDLTGMHAVVLGRSLIVGRPVGLMLLHAQCTVTLMHSRSRRVPDLCRQADIVISAVGQPHLVTKNFIKEGATVIDVGISRLPTPEGTMRLVGDVDFEEVAPIAGFITPVPGGVGPMTVCCLMKNTLDAAENQRKEHGI